MENRGTLLIAPPLADDDTSLWVNRATLTVRR